MVIGQAKLKEKSALVIGCGGLGCPAALYLAASGVGRLGFVDYDTIELTNLQRQIAYNEETVGKSKARVLAQQCKLYVAIFNYYLFIVLII